MKLYPTSQKLALLFASFLLIGGLLFFLNTSPESEMPSRQNISEAKPSAQSVSGNEAPEVSVQAVLPYLEQAAIDIDTLAELLTERRDVMRELMVDDPAAAWEQRLTLAQYAAIPEELRHLVETPFAQTVRYDVLPICGNMEGAVVAKDHFATIQFPRSQESLSLQTYDRQEEIGSKDTLPVYGIFLGGLAVVDSRRAVPLDADELPLAAFILRSKKIEGQRIDPLSGEALSAAEAHYALVGQSLVAFESRENIDRFNDQIREIEKTPGPRMPDLEAFLKAATLAPSSETHTVNSSIAYQNLQAAGEGAVSPVANFEAAVQASGSDWTTTPKSVYFIIVDFFDQPGDPVTQATLEGILNLNVADQIRDMSYGKTWIEADVYASTVRIPNPTTTYLPDNNGLLHDDAKAAFDALNTGVNLDDYDIVGVYFASIGMSGGGITYAGLAGGGRQWLQNSMSERVITHEFGHNYGLGHSSFWDTSASSGTVVGSGASVTYGDNFDIMGSGASPEGHFHPQAKERLEWLEPDEWVDATVGGSGIYRLHRFDHVNTDTTTLRGLRIDKGMDEYYWFGLRQNFPELRPLKQGAYALWQQSGSTRSWLIDTTPGSAEGKDDAAIELGVSYSDSAVDVVVTPVAYGGEAPDHYIDLAVQFAPPVGNNAPTGDIYGPSTVPIRQASAFQVVSSDVDGDTVYPIWDFGDGEDLASGSSVAYSFKTGGSKSIQVRLNDTKGGATTVSHLVTIDDPAATWNSRLPDMTAGSEKDFRDICIGEDGSGDPIALAISYGSFKTSSTISDDGTTWSTTEILLSNANMQKVTYTGQRFIAVGEDYDFDISAWVGSIITSNDGTTWAQPLVLASAGTGFNGIASNGSTHVAVGDNGTVYYSTDAGASTWTQTTTAATEHLYDVAYGDGVFVAVGGASNGSSVQVFTSSDGINWMDFSSGAGVASWNNFYTVEYLDSLFMANGWYSSIRTSSDHGQSFTSMLSDRHITPALAYGNGLFFAAGINKDDSDAPIDLYSTDGSTWNTASPPGVESRVAATFFNNTFITVGTGGTIWQSAEIPPLNQNWTEYQAATFSGFSNEIGFAEDFDLDGIDNGVEFAKGMDPKVSNTSADTFEIDGSLYPIYTISMVNTLDVAAIVEVSTNLVDWSASNVVEVSRSDSQWVVRSSETTTQEPKQFFRVNYIQAK